MEETPRLAEAGVRPGIVPPGIDYIDELDHRGGSVMGPDAISMAVKASVYVANAQLPWARLEPKVPGVPGEFIRFTRLYPGLKLLIDVWPQKVNLNLEHRDRLLAGAVYRKALAHKHGYAYVGMFGDERVYAEVFEEALAEVPETVEPIATELEIPAMHGPVLDSLSREVGDSIYTENKRFPWAVLRPGTPLADPLIFDRFYHKQNLLIDVLPDPFTQSRGVRERQQREINEKTRLCKEHGVEYRVIYKKQALGRGTGIVVSGEPVSGRSGVSAVVTEGMEHEPD